MTTHQLGGSAVAAQEKADQPVRGGAGGQHQVPSATPAGRFVPQFLDNPRRAPAATLLGLQRFAGNRAVASVIAARSNGAVRAPLNLQRDGPGEQSPATGSPEPNQSVAPPPDANASTETLHVLTYQGKEYAIPESQWPAFLTGLKGTFRREVVGPIKSRMESARSIYDSMAELNDDQWAVAWVLETVRTGINLDEVTPIIEAGEAALEELDGLVDGDDLGATQTAARTAEEKADAAYAAITEYRDLQISAGGATVTALQITETVCFTIFAIAGGAVLAAPVAAGGLGLGAVSSGAIMGGGTALLSSASGVGAKAVYGDEVGWEDVKNVAIETAVGAAGGAVGSAIAAKLAPFLGPALTKSLLANGMFTDVSEEVLAHAVRGVVAGASGGMVQGAITDGVKVLEGKATFEQLLRNVVTNLIVGGIAGLVGARLTAGKGVAEPSATEPAATEPSATEPTSTEPTSTEPTSTEPTATEPSEAPAETTPQTRNVRVANPELVAEYEGAANEKIPEIVTEVVGNERATQNRARLQELQTQFEQLRSEVGDATELTADQRIRANEILQEARDISRRDFSGLQTKVMKQLRADPDLQAIEQRMVDAGDAQAPETGSLRIRTVRADGTERFEPINLEHKVRLSDNPWLAKGSRNLIATDAPQNQQYLEAIRQQGGVWPTDPIEDFVVRFQLNDQGVDFAPGTR
jgi:hypothetical protein